MLSTYESSTKYQGRIFKMPKPLHTMDLFIQL